MRTKHFEACVGRPRLRDYLPQSASRVFNVGATNSEVVGAGMDSFSNWMARVRFPNTISLKLKRSLYFLMSQHNLDHALITQTFNNSLITSAVFRETITRPDHAVIADIIASFNMRRAPFSELSDFMRKCFRAFPQKSIHELTLMKYMHLYVASYQHKDIWKFCWTSIYPMLTYQVIKDVEDFVANTPLNQAELLVIVANDKQH